MRRIVLRVVAGLLALVVVALVGGYWYERPLLLTGTGYAAHNACALSAIAGRTDAESDLPPNPLVPYLRSSVESTKATSTILGVLADQTAWATTGFGCTLGAGAPSLGAATAIGASGNPFSAAAASAPVTADAPLNAMLGKAFGDDLAPAAKKDLGTRGIVVVRDGAIVAERYADGFTKDTPQLGWSMSKSVASLLVGRLVKDGAVKLTDDHLRPEWTDDRAKITLEQLLRMTSGLSWDETYDLGTPITQMLYGENDMAGFVAARPLAHAPGTYQQYSSGSTNLLCSILTKKAGVAADLPRRALLGPLGLSSAVWEPDAVGTPVCSSYLWATPRDWAALGQFALQDGVWNGTRLLPEGWTAATTTAQKVDTSEEVGYAAGWWANKAADGTLVDPRLPADTYSMNGHDGQRVYVVPSKKLVVVRLGFSPSVESKDLRVADLVAALTA